MKRALLLLLLLSFKLQAQTLYFPPNSGNIWDTISPSSLGWCASRVDSLYNYLEARHTKAFLILKDGKIVLEHYFGSFTKDSVWYWASASKSLTSMLTGIAQQDGFLQLTDTVSNYLGNGWTTCTTSQERAITIRHLLTMTSGLNDTITAPCTNEDTAATCLQFLAPAGFRWAYHTGVYRKLEDVVSTATGVNYNLYTVNKIGSHIGMTGAWINQEYFSKPRSMARFGLLALNKGVWANDTILHDTNYFKAMTNTSQNFNLSYGYLWWLNGKTSCMVPGLQIVFQQSIFPAAPVDLFAALGKNDQKIYVVPSKKMVVIRMGDAAYSSALAFTQFDNELWQKIDSLPCSLNAAFDQQPKQDVLVYPNPASNLLSLSMPLQTFSIVLYDLNGNVILSQSNNTEKAIIDCSLFPAGNYFLKLISNKNCVTEKIVIQK